jgi:hypothetical protein
MVNTTQVGGSLGTALLNTLFASAVAGYLVSHGSGSAAAASAAMEGYGTAFLWAAGIVAVGAALTALLFRTALRPRRSPPSRSSPTRPCRHGPACVAPDAPGRALGRGRDLRGWEPARTVVTRVGAGNDGQCGDGEHDGGDDD